MCSQSPSQPLFEPSRNVLSRNVTPHRPRDGKIGDEHFASQTRTSKQLRDIIRGKLFSGRVSASFVEK